MGKARKRVTRVGRYRVEDSSVPGRPGDEFTLDELASYQRRAARVVLSEISHVEPEVLRYARKALGITQAELAGVLDVTAETISRWETGAEPFKRAVQLAVARLLDIAEVRGVEGVRALAELTTPSGDVTLKAS